MTKLETACGRTIVKLMNDWNPILFIDAHATDGSYMRHAVTYNWGLNAGTDAELLAYNRTGPARGLLSGLQGQGSRPLRQLGLLLQRHSSRGLAHL